MHGNTKKQNFRLGFIHGGKRIITVLEEQDEFPHEPDDVTNYNESMYLNTFDLDQEIGGWFRLGNRVNEGYAEMTVCLYLPNGQIGFMYDRPKLQQIWR